MKKTNSRRIKIKSSSNKIPYDIRPSKQTERRFLLDILRAGSEAGLNLSDVKYLGFGGFKFYDFEMLFRHLGIRDMTSVECDKSLFPRCKFNKPFNFIDLQQGTLAEFLERSTFRKPIIAWLDYDSRLSRDIIDDVVTIGAKAVVNSFIFVTIDARMPEGYKIGTTKGKIASVLEDLEGYALNPNDTDMEPKNFPRYAERVLWAALNTALAKRPDGQFVPLMRVFYEDTTLMITVGGCLCNKMIADDFDHRIKKNFPFLLPRMNQAPYTIPPFNFSMRERYLLDHAVTFKKDSKEAYKRLQRIGIPRAMIDDYRRMVRFVPKYFESYI